MAETLLVDGSLRAGVAPLGSVRPLVPLAAGVPAPEWSWEWLIRGALLGLPAEAAALLEWNKG